MPKKHKLGVEDYDFVDKVLAIGGNCDAVVGRSKRADTIFA